MNRKRFAAAALSLLLSLVLCLAVLPGMAEADGVDDILTPPSNPGDLVLWIQAWETLVGQWDDNYTQPGNLQYEKIRDDTEIMITGVENGQDLDRLAIPAVLDGLPVTAIGPGAFAGLDIYFAILPNSLTAIGEGAFTGCNLMHTLSVPFIGPSRDSASNLGYLGVSGAGGAALLQVFVTDAAKIADGAFSGCSGLKTIQFLGHRENVTMGDSAFSGCTGLESLVLPEGLSSVGDYAFQNCTSFKEFTVPDSVQTMGCGAFKGCTNLEKLTLPFVGKERGISEQSEAVFGYIFGGSPYDGATQIDQHWNPSNLIGNFIPNGLTSVTITDESVIGYGAFENLSQLTSLTYPLDKVEQVDGRAFAGCSGLTDLPIPTKVTVLKERTFEGCTGLTAHPAIPAAVKTIETYAFLDCTGFTTLNIPETVETIGRGAFSGCSGLTSVTLPFIGQGRGISEQSEAVFGYIFGGSSYDGATQIAQFWNPSNQTGNFIPDSLTSVTITDESVIGYGAFDNLSQLTSLTYPLDKVEQVDGRAFAGCSGLTELPIPTKVTVLKERTFEGCTGLTAHPAIPAAVKTIETYAFLDCTGFTTLNIPETVETIGRGAFSGCSGLTSVTLPFIGQGRGISEQSEAVFGYIFGGSSYDGATQIAQFWNPSNQTGNFIPDSLTSVTITDESVIGYGAFDNLSQLTSLTYPADQITKLGGRAFAHCNQLSDLPIPPAVDTVPNYCFLGCTALPADYTVPDTVKTIASYAYQDCTSLKVLTVPNSVEKIEAGAFSGCSGLTSVTLPFIGQGRGISEQSEAVFGYIFGGSSYDGATQIAQFWNPSNQTGNFIPDSLTSVTITDETVIGYGAFDNLSQLTSLTYPADQITKLGGRAFAHCNQLSDLPIPPAVDTVPNYCFLGCTALPADYTVPDTVKTIASYAYQDCTSLKVLTVPNSVEKIEAGAFSGCSGLTSVTLPFIGQERGISEQSEAVFGYIFGGSPYDGATQIAQFWNPSNRTGNFIPDSLRSITVNDESVVPYGAFQNCTMLRQITYPAPIDTVGDRAYDNCPAVIVVMCYTTETGEIATLETAREAGKVNLNLTLDEKLAEEAPTVFFAVYDVQGRMILLKEWTEVETGVPFEQSIVLPDGVELGRVQTMVLSDKSIPLMNAFRLT